MTRRLIIASKYREFRKRLGFTQGELAKHLGIAENTVSRRELGNLPINREAQLAITRLLKLKKWGLL